MKKTNVAMVTENEAQVSSTDVMLARTVMKNSYELWGKRIAAIPVSLLKLDESYQRILSANVKKLMAEWDESKCTFLLVSYRDDVFYVVDGQHRLAVAKGKGIVDLPCIILTGLTREQEALVFARQNRNVTKLNPFDTYKANIACGNKEIPEVFTDMEISRICKKYNIEVKKVYWVQNNPKTLRSLSRARQIVSGNGSSCFEWILNTVTSSKWNMCSEAYTKHIMIMLRNYYTENVGNLDNASKVITSVMNKTTPMEIVAMANYEFSEYPQGTALDLCLKELTGK